jgi:hypothetical protein
VLIILVPLAAQTDISEKEYTSLAMRLSAGFADPHLPRSEFSTITATLNPGIYRSANQDIRIVPGLVFQWWVSPNLALYGGLGSGISNKAIAQLQGIGFRFLPGSLNLGRFTPELAFSQHRIEGDRDYTLKWNEFRLLYALHMARQSYAVGIMLQYPRMFPSSASRAPGVPSKLEISQRSMTISVGYEILPWLQLAMKLELSQSSFRRIIDSAIITGSLLVSVAI